MGVLPCPTTRLNNLTVRFQGRADYRQPPDPTEALVGGRYRRPVCRRARGQGLGWAVGCGARGARRPGCPQRMPGHTDLPRLAHMPWAPGLRVFGLTSPPFPVCVSRGGAFPGGGVFPGGVIWLPIRQAGRRHTHSRHNAGDASNFFTVECSRCGRQIAAQGPSVRYSRADVEPQAPDRVWLHRL